MRSCLQVYLIKQQDTLFIKFTPAFMDMFHGGRFLWLDIQDKTDGAHLRTASGDYETQNE